MSSVRRRRESLRRRYVVSRYVVVASPLRRRYVVSRYDVATS